MPMDKAEHSVPQLIQLGLSHLTRKLPHTHRALVLLKDPVSGNMIVRAAHNVDTERLGSSAAMSTRVLKQVRERGKSQLVLDALQDGQFRTLRDEARSEFRSALCVPVPDGGHRTIGLLYADNPHKPAAFTPGDQSELERFARELGRQIEKARQKGFTEPPPSARKAQAGPSALKAAAVPLALFGLALLWAVVGAGLGAFRPEAPRPSATPTRAATTTRSAEPRTIAESFLRFIRLRETRQAWNLLSPGLQKSLPQTRFHEQVENWLADDVNRWELEFRRTVEGRRGETILTLYVEPDPKKAPRKPIWKWTLRKTEKGWRIDAMNGAPLSEAKPKRR